MAKKYPRDARGFAITPSRLRAAKRKGKVIRSMTPSRMRALRRRRGY